MQSPRALNRWPLTTSPTGTEMAWPRSCTSWPRTTPSVGCIEIVRTWLSPRCCATSRVSVLVSSPSVTWIFRALNSSGTSPRGNSTSTTGPRMRVMRPTAPCEPFCSVPSAVAVDWVIVAPLLGEGVGAANDLADLLRDLGLAGLVRFPGQVVDQVVRVVGRRLHRALPGRRLRRRGVEQGREHPRAEVLRHEPVEEHLRLRLELVLGLPL